MDLCIFSVALLSQRTFQIHNQIWKALKPTCRWGYWLKSFGMINKFELVWNVFNVLWATGETWSKNAKEFWISTSRSLPAHRCHSVIGLSPHTSSYIFIIYQGCYACQNKSSMTQHKQSKCNTSSNAIEVLLLTNIENKLHLSIQRL